MNSRFLLKGIFVLTFFLFGTLLHGQTELLPPAYNTSTGKVNWVKSYDVFKANMDVTGIKSTSVSPNDVMLSTQFMDGLGRPIQTVMRKGSPNLFDMVQPVYYDDLGRQSHGFLSYESIGNDGVLRISPFTEQNTFFDAHFSGEAFYYTENQFEASPLGRVKKQLAPGNSWGGSSRGVSSQYLNNTSAMGIRKWVVGYTGTPTSSSAYGANELTVMLSTDEAGKTIRQFTDKRGQMLLKQVEFTGTGNSHSDWLNTYYVYDNKGNLRFVLPPKAVEMLYSGGTNWNYTAANISKLVFEYTYDKQNRMIEKRVPGAELTEMVYDKLDRLVASRDGKGLIAGEWLFTKYDAFNRPVITGMYKSSASRIALQGILDAWTDDHMVRTDLQASENVIEGVNIYLSHHEPGTTVYKVKNGGTIEFLPGFDSGSDEFETQYASTLNHEYTYYQGYYDKSFPTIKEGGENFTAGETKVLTINYFDDYDFTSTSWNSDYTGFYASGTNNAETPAAYMITDGLATGSKTKVLGTDDTWLTSVVYYDSKGRPIQTQSENHKGGLDVTTNQYDFAGKVLRSYTVHKNPEADDFTDVRFLKTFSYDHAGRLKDTKMKRYNSSNIAQESDQIIASNSYNSLGELSTKNLANAQQTLNYEYNIRGWLNKINNPSSLGTDYFGMALKYDNATTATNQFNGNIAEIDWKSVGDQDYKRYEYAYDAVNRLTGAVYKNTTNTSQNGAFTVSGIGYDANGNITSLNRSGKVLTSISPIDQLVYTYDYANMGNQLKKVTDNAGNAGIKDFKDLSNATTEYTYDKSGNMLTDLNKGISNNITYNYLNLPQLVNMGNGQTITYVYDAAGTKLQKIANDNGVVTTTDYLAGSIFQNNTLQQIAHEEGRVRKNSQGNLVYDYVIKDHLGNTRVTFTSESQPVDIYKATMETENDVEGNNIQAYENQFFYNLDDTRSALVSEANKSTQGDDGCTVCNEAALTNGMTQPVGPAILLDVMPGDELDLEVWAYNQGSISSATERISTTGSGSLVSFLTNAFVPGGSGSELYNQTSGLFNGISGTVTGGGSPGSSRPFAYLNYIVFDANFTVKASNHLRVQDVPNAQQSLTLNDIAIAQKGYIYIWVSNESNENMNVFFDDLKVVHTKGQILQEDHYYPFGLNISALSSTAPLSKPNNFKYNGKELDENFDLNLYSYGAREYDPQLGKFTTVDPMADQRSWVSPYNFVQNNPLNRIDPDGRLDDWVESADGKIYWDDNATSQATTKEGEKYLGKNVLVGTHNRDASGNESVNSATFDLYLESNKSGSSATIKGNTVPSDITKYGTLAEGLYSAKFGRRNAEKYKNELAIRIYNLDGTDGLPTLNGNPSKANSDLLTGVLFHSGNPYQESLRDRAGNPVWSHGCQTSGCGSGSKGLHNAFMEKVGTDFNGAYYLRAKPQPVQNSFNFRLPVFTVPVDNTYVAPRVIFNR